MTKDELKEIDDRVRAIPQWQHLGLKEMTTTHTVLDGSLDTFTIERHYNSKTEALIHPTAFGLWIKDAHSDMVKLIGYVEYYSAIKGELEVRLEAIKRAEEKLGIKK